MAVGDHRACVRPHGLMPGHADVRDGYDAEGEWAEGPLGVEMAATAGFVGDCGTERAGCLPNLVAPAFFGAVNVDEDLVAVQWHRDGRVCGQVVGQVAKTGDELVPRLWIGGVGHGISFGVSGD